MELMQFKKSKEWSFFLALFDYQQLFRIWLKSLADIEPLLCLHNYKVSLLIYIFHATQYLWLQHGIFTRCFSLGDTLQGKNCENEFSQKQCAEYQNREWREEQRNGVKNSELKQEARTPRLSIACYSLHRSPILCAFSHQLHA